MLPILLRQARPRLHRVDLSSSFVRGRSCSSSSSEVPAGFFARLKASVQTERGQFILGNFSYVLQFAGFMCSEMLPMRSFLIGGSMSFVCYALVQPKKLWVPAVWETTFASIHAYKIAELLSGDRIALTSQEIRLYGLLFGHHQDLDPKAFKRLADIGTWVTYDPGEVLTVENKHVQKVRMIISGDVKLELNKEHVGDLGSGRFLGEMALMEQFVHLHDDKTECQTDWALAFYTSKATSKISCFEWDTDKLIEYLDKDGDSGALIKSFFEDVMKKVATMGEDNAKLKSFRRAQPSSAKPQATA